MVDEEVENVLREIRERVRAEQQPHRSSATPAESLPAGTSLPGDARVELSADSAPLAVDARARIEAYLTTTARTWDRLPPVVSNRSGWQARLELWFKRRFKSATRWYFWEQVNFNAAVHHALGDALEALADYERQLAQLRAGMHAEFERRQGELDKWSADFIETRRTEFDGRSVELEAQRNELTARLSAAEKLSAVHVAQLRDAHASIATQLRDEVRAHADALRLEQGAHAASLQQELRERDEHLRDEGRVSFRQLSLEAGEAAVMQDRARRQLEARLDKLESSKAVTSDE